ncbi:hypothetical protein [Microbacterium deminutum]|uniref:hypothetical protein n=1 Tax=Microbacterium deminutum TaxID=344164 RepID=UPI003CD0A28F
MKIGFDAADEPVSAVVDYFGLTDILAMPDTERGEDGVLSRLLGGPVAERADLAREASPITHLHPDAPPMLAFHGTDDGAIDIDQSRRFRRSCTRDRCTSGARRDRRRRPRLRHGRHRSDPRSVDRISRHRAQAPDSLVRACPRSRYGLRDLPRMRSAACGRRQGGISGRSRALARRMLGSRGHRHERRLKDRVAEDHLHGEPARPQVRNPRRCKCRFKSHRRRAVAVVLVRLPSGRLLCRFCAGCSVATD